MILTVVAEYLGQFYIKTVWIIGALSVSQCLLQEDLKEVRYCPLNNQKVSDIIASLSHEILQISEDLVPLF